MTDDLCRMLVDSFVKTSWSSVKAIVEKLATWGEEASGRPVSFFRFKNNQRVNATFEGNHFFLRSSVEYSNQQLTVEEVQGIIGAKLLEVCANYFFEIGLHTPDANDMSCLCELVKK